MSILHSEQNSDFKILALHGKGENGGEFRKRLAKLVDMCPQVTWEFLTAPHLIGDENEFAWWTLPPKVRSFEAAEYTGIEQTFEVRERKCRQTTPPSIF